MDVKIIVCVKRAPDTEARIRMADDGGSIDPSGIKYVMSPYDEFAVEAALRLKEELGDGEVVVLSLGPGEAKETIRQGLAMGADRGVLLKGEPSMDGLATAKALKAEVEGEEPDLVLLGVKAVDDDQQQVGAMLGTLLGRPCATAVTGFDHQDGKLTCRRGVEGGTEVVDVSLPGVLTITKGEFEPRYASLKGIMAAKKKPLEEKEAEVPEPALRVRSLEPPPERSEARIVGEGPDAAAELVRALREEAKVL